MDSKPLMHFVGSLEGKLMRKFLLTLAVLATASPVWAVTMAQWASTPIVSGDKTFTLNSTNITNTSVNVLVQDLGASHELNLSNLTGITSNFTVNFTISVNSGPNVIHQGAVTANKYSLSSGNAPSVTTWNPGAFSDSLVGTGNGSVHTFDATSVTINTSATISSSARLSNITYGITQIDPTAVPEPSTFVLGGLGVLGLVFARRRAGR